MHGWVGGWMHGWVGGWLHGWMGAWVDGIDEWVDGWVDRWEKQGHLVDLHSNNWRWRGAVFSEGGAAGGRVAKSQLPLPRHLSEWPPLLPDPTSPSRSPLHCTLGLLKAEFSLPLHQAWETRKGDLEPATGLRGFLRDR